MLFRSLVNIRHVGRQRARELAALGLREPKDVLHMSSKQRESLLNLRGWGPLLLEKIDAEIQRVLRRKEREPRAVRDDDSPLEGERSDDL